MRRVPSWSTIDRAHLVAVIGGVSTNHMASSFRSRPAQKDPVMPTAVRSPGSAAALPASNQAAPSGPAATPSVDPLAGLMARLAR